VGGVTAEVVDLAVIRGAVEAARPMTAAEVAAVEEQVRADLSSAVAHLHLLRDADAHLVAGFASWGAYVADRFGDLLDRLRLAVEDRRAVVHALREDGEAQAAIARRLGVSGDTVSRDLLATGDPAPDRITGADGRSMPSRTGRAAAPAGPLWQQAFTVTVRRGERGVTLVELARALRITEGSASGLLTYLGPADRAHPQRKGLVERTEDRRGGQRVHVAVAP
jgi:transposase-like protein